MILLDNGRDVRVGVAPEHGATLCSLQLRSEGEWQELLYRANDWSKPDGWRGQAPWLFPAVGRNYTEEQLRREPGRPASCSYRLGGQTLPIPIHGFAMDSVWQVEAGSQTPDRFTCILRDTPETRAYYPFQFEARVEFYLLQNEVKTSFHVRHIRGAQERMPFSIGNHLTLRMPLPDGSDMETCLLRGPATRLYTVEPPGFEGAGRDISLIEGVPLTAPFCANALLGGFSGPEAEMSLQAKSFCVRVTQRVLTPGVPGTGSEEYRFVLYEDGTRRFFCLEPWLGRPNSLNTGQGAILLETEQSFCWEMTIQWEAL